MLVPYAYIQIGDNIFFQPQNIYKGYEVRLTNSTPDVWASGNPEYRSKLYIFINGHTSRDNYKILRIPTNEFPVFKTIIDQHNERLTNV